MSRSLAPGSIRAARLGRYRHTTLEMAGRVIEAIEHRLTIVLKVAEQTLKTHPYRPVLRVF